MLQSVASLPRRLVEFALRSGGIVRIKSSVLVGSVVLVSIALVLTACSGGDGPDTSRGSVTTGTVVTSISDPATCEAPNGPYSNIYVTVVDVQIHQSSTAAAADSGWVDLTPNLTPTQIDLLGTANTSCFLASLGSNTQIPSGTYQQIRVILLDNSKASQVTNNQCENNAANCVVLASDGSKHALNLSSEANTGIKIPSGQLAGGQFVVDAGQTNDLDIDFNACASVVVQGNGQFRLKPVLHAGEVSVNTSSISGKVVDSVTKSVISGGTVVVALEAVDSTGVARVVMETIPDGAGNFVFCPVPPGTYIVVAVAVDGNGVAYAPTITTGVQPGNALGQVPVIAQVAPNTAAGSITGQITSANAANTGTSIDVSLAALESASISGSNVLVTIPDTATSSATLSLATGTDVSCPANTQCATYSVDLPVTLPNIGAFATGGATYAQASGAATYTMDALAFVPASGGTATCSPSEQKSPTPLAVTSGATTNAPALAFTGCQ